MTRKLLVLVMMILILLLTSKSWSAPRLVCDPQEGVTFYNLRINNIDTLSNEPAQPDGSADIDLGPLNLPDGNLVFELQAGNTWGVSDWSVPLDVIKRLPLPPSGGRLEP